MDGYALVEGEQSKWNYISIKGDLLFEDRWFDAASYFTKGLAWVHILNKGWGLINNKGCFIYPKVWFKYWYSKNLIWWGVMANGDLYYMRSKKLHHKIII